MQKYVFRKYDSKYRTFYILEKKKLIKTLGPAAKIEHVGSTSIPNLGGKGILDIVVGASRTKIAQTKIKLEKAGYEFREIASVPERLFFRVDYLHNNRKRRVHVHLTPSNSQDWKELTKFRDYLLKQPEIVEQYAKIKKEAVEQALGDGEKYRKYKENFIKKTLKKAMKE